MPYHIIAIGISKYISVCNLTFAHKDAIEFHRLFQHHIRDLGYQQLLVDTQATRQAMQNAIGVGLEQEVRMSDTLLFFFSGHGTVGKSPEGTGYSHYLAPHDATADYADSCISVEFLRDSLRKIPCENKFIFIDCCFSGSINSKSCSRMKPKSVANVKTFRNTVSGNGYITFTASKDDQEAIEDSQLRHGLFTYYLLAELKSNKYKDRIDPLAIYEPVTRNVVDRANKAHRSDQTPTLNGQVQGLVYLPVLTDSLHDGGKPEVYAQPSTKHGTATFEEVYQFAYSTNGMNMYRPEAEAFAKMWMQQYPDKDFQVFIDVFRFAYSTDGMNKYRPEAEAFAHMWIQQYADKDFNVFKRKFRFAYSIDGMNKYRHEAEAFALEEMSRIEDG